MPAASFLAVVRGAGASNAPTGFPARDSWRIAAGQPSGGEALLSGEFSGGRRDRIYRRATSTSDAGDGGVGALLAGLEVDGEEGSRGLEERNDEGEGATRGSRRGRGRSGGGSGEGRLGASSQQLRSPASARSHAKAAGALDGASAESLDGNDSDTTTRSAAPARGCGGGARGDDDDPGDTGTPESSTPGASQPNHRRALEIQGEKSRKHDVEAHVADRAARALRLREHASRRGPCRACLLAWVVSHATLMSVAAVSLVMCVIGAFLQYLAPGASFGDNSVFKWVYLFGSAGLSFVPLAAAEWALFAALDVLAAQGGLLVAEAVDFASAAKGLLAPIAVVVFALLLRTAVFDLSLSPPDSFIFSATCATLLVGLCGSVCRVVGLKLTLRRIFKLKHKRAVHDVLFYEET